MKGMTVKAKLTGKIKSISVDETGDRGSSSSGGITVKTYHRTKINLDMTGAVTSDLASGKEISAEVVLFMKPLFAEQLRFGQTLTFVMTDEET